MPIRYETDGAIAHVIVDRPEVHNAFDDALTEELAAAWARFEAGPERVAVVSGGASKHFTVGADLKNMPRDVWRSVPGIASPVRKPVIAAIHGHCVGVGVALVQAADLCVSEEGAKLLYSEPRLGLAYGLITGLASRVPHKFAMEMMLCGETIAAERAFDMGLINAITPRGGQVERAMTMARSIAQAAPKVVRWLKHGVDAEVLADGPTAHSLRALSSIRDMQESADSAEGRAAFVAKRPPRFEDR